MAKTLSVLAFLACTAQGRRLQRPEKPLEYLLIANPTLVGRGLYSLKMFLLHLLMLSSILAFNPSTFESRFAKLTNVRSGPVVGIVSPTISMDSDVPLGKFPRLRPIKHGIPIFGTHSMITYIEIQARWQETDVVDVGLQHGELLPESFSSRIPSRDEGILRFFLDYLKAEDLGHINVSITGGYVRDLLMGYEPDDLDLTVDLRSCSNETTIMGLLHKLDDFAKQQPHLGIREVDIKTHFSQEAVKKQIDAFKAEFHNDRGQKSEVDVLPTCGEEVYEEGSRTPYRDWRASPEQDALRRDLTVGSIMLQVERDTSCPSGLSYRLFDFYGGVSDLATGTLRAPVPTGESYESLSAQVLRTEDQRELAKALGLHNLTEPEAVQTLWWAKALMDDPIRVCRAVRFSATLRGFELHKTFWDAVPFALLSLHGSISGNRKMKEYMKVAESGFEACVYFVELAFTQKFGPKKPLGIRDSGLHGNLTLASSLFRGISAGGPLKGLKEHTGFDKMAFRTLSGSMAPYDGIAVEPEELLLGTLIAAQASAVGLECSSEEFTHLGEGLQFKGPMIKKGRAIVNIARSWAEETVPPNVLDSGFAEACGVSSEDMCLYWQFWKDAFSDIPPWTLQQRELTYRLAQRFMIGKARGFSDSRKLTRLAEALWVVTRDRPLVKGKVFAEPAEIKVPFKLRTQVISLLEVGTRLLGYDAPLDNAEDLQALFLAFPKIRLALSQQNLDSLEPPDFLFEKKKKKLKQI